MCLISLRLATNKDMMMDVKLRTIFMVLSFCKRLAYSQMFDYSSILKQAWPKDDCDFILVSHSEIAQGKNPNHRQNRNNILFRFWERLHQTSGDSELLA